MAFFDKISRSVTDAGQKTIAKTKEFADTSRLNSMISEQEKIVVNQYYQIGKLYYSEHRNDYEEIYAGMINIITEAEERIQNYKTQIQDIKGVRRCENCGAEVPLGDAFCSSCGSPMPQNHTEQVDTVRCTNCGAYVKKNMRFCTSCGTPMKVNNLVNKEVIYDTANQPQEIEDKNEPTICPNCGAEVENGMLFCAECGTKIK